MFGRNKHATATTDAVPLHWPTPTEVVTKADLLVIANAILAEERALYSERVRKYEADKDAWRAAVRELANHDFEANRGLVPQMPAMPWLGSDYDIRELEFNIATLHDLPDGPVPPRIREALHMSRGSTRPEYQS